MGGAEEWAKEMGGKLRRARVKSGIRREDIADCLGLSVEGYGHYERARSIPSLEHLVKLTKILRVPITELLPDSVIIDYDRARASDPNLAKIINAWPNLSDWGREHLMDALEIACKLSEKS